MFNGADRRVWEEFFSRYRTANIANPHALRDYLKHGKWLGYWLEFLFQSFAGYTGNMILAQGVPDDPASLPHADPKRRL